MSLQQYQELDGSALHRDPQRVQLPQPVKYSGVVVCSARFLRPRPGAYCFTWYLACRALILKTPKL